MIDNTRKGRRSISVATPVEGTRFATNHTTVSAVSYSHVQSVPGAHVVRTIITSSRGEKHLHRTSAEC